jgi:5-methylcytosine-specific restriction enzyme A
LNRKQFISSHGATCRNWTWSWSFVNEDQRFVIFGAWDIHVRGTRILILSKDWETSRRGKLQSGYAQAKEHIRLVEEEGYALKTFPMRYSQADETDDVSPTKIGGFTPTLSDKKLLRVGDNWYAMDGEVVSAIPEELSPSDALIEGAAVTVPVNKYERSYEARVLCIAHHGYNCAICNFDFEKFYGALGRHYIHVHHIVPLGEIKATHEVDPIKDMVPICPNCHAMVHSTRPAIGIDQLKKHLADMKSKSSL